MAPAGCRAWDVCIANGVNVKLCEGKKSRFVSGILQVCIKLPSLRQCMHSITTVNNLAPDYDAVRSV